MPDIHYNFASGSDSQASGAPYDMSPIFGTGASTASSTSVDLSADSPNLSAVPTDGTAVLWVETSSGRQWGQITAVNDTTKVVTVSSTYDVTATGQTWAIGGKRKTLDTYQQLFSGGGADWAGGWNILLEDDQTISTTLNRVFFISTMTIGSDVPGVRRTIAQSTSGIAVIDVFASTSDTATLIDLKLTNTNPVKTTGTRGLTRTTSGSGSAVQLLNCEIGDETDQLYYGLHGSTLAIDCYIHHCIDYGTSGSMIGCVVTNNGIGHYSANVGMYAYNSFICDNTGDGISIEHQYSNMPLVHHCTIANNGGDGVGYSAGSGGGSGGVFKNNSITGNGTYGVGYPPAKSIFINNNFGTGATANGSGAIAGAVKLEQGSTFTDPMYLDAANGDYRIPSNSPNANAATQSWGGIAYRRSIGAADVVQDAGGPTDFYYLNHWTKVSNDPSWAGGADISLLTPEVDTVGASWTTYAGVVATDITGRIKMENTDATVYGTGTYEMNLATFESGISDFKATFSVFSAYKGGFVFRHNPANYTFYMYYISGGSMHLYYFNGATFDSFQWSGNDQIPNGSIGAVSIEVVGDQAKLYTGDGNLATTQTLANNSGHTRFGLMGVGSYDFYTNFYAITPPGIDINTVYPPETVGRQPAIPHPLFAS